ncbi:site-2 protease family protein [Massilia sp. PAMC28688]|uniref:site-2 protease family protein n=1 Tax=Massilia sp. PAMC28688 TaxID=2861283 RepID=UPI001C6267C9|nr:site-2 protease family protein [Massilia sp. PAMC28688]QYF92151.1 site-2 protease family protein [Massilia sp. PAMC28688]
MTIQETVSTVINVAIPLLFAISLHEAAHGYAARYFGDPTAANEGRLSLNPLRHIDPFGTVILPLALYLTTQVAVGFAKPVPVEVNRLRNPHRQMALVALAGPMANFVMGLGWTLLGLILLALRVPSPDLAEMIRAGIVINAAMFVFNLIPVPPLDGGRVLTAMLPKPLALRFAAIERYSVVLLVILVVLMYSRVLDGFMSTGISFVAKIFRLILTPFNIFLN